MDLVPNSLLAQPIHFILLGVIGLLGTFVGLLRSMDCTTVWRWSVDSRQVRIGHC